MMSPAASRVLALLAGATLSGCAVGPNFHQPAAPQTDRYTLQPLPASEGDADSQTFVPGPTPPADWWRGFGSSEIDAMVEQALQANPTVQSAEATLRQSLENVAAQRGSYFPTVQGQFSATRNRDAVQVLSPTLTSGAPTYALYTPQLTISYEDELERDQAGTVKRVLDYVGVALPPAWQPAPRVARQADAINDEWYDAYHREAAARLARA